MSNLAGRIAQLILAGDEHIFAQLFLQAALRVGLNGETQTIGTVDDKNQQ